MGKVLAGVVIGIFVGALASEILKRKNPELTRKIEQKAKDTVDAFAKAYGELDGGTGSPTPEQSPS